MVTRLEEVANDSKVRWTGLLLIITTAFVFTNALALSLAFEEKISWQHFWAPGIWLIAIAGAYLILSLLRPEHDPIFLALYALLTGWGIILIDRLAANFLARQVLWVILGTGVMLAVAILPHNLRPLRRYRYTLLIAGLFLLALTLIFGVNPSGYGAALWLPLPLPYSGPVIFFQPSELLKLLLLIFLSSYFADRGPLLRQNKRAGIRGQLPFLIPLLLMWGFCMIFLVWQRDLGAATLFFILFLAFLYVATGSKLYVVSGLLLLLFGGFLAYFLFDVVSLRVDAWWNPWPEALDRAYQIVQSLYAIASGGVMGQGIGQGFPYYIPVVHSDFIFAAVAEEWGLVGGLAIVGIFLMLAYRGFRLAMINKRPFRFYLATGITLIFSTQALLIMGGVTKLVPLTGVTLPLISYGGSSLFISSIMMGLLIFISSESA